MTIVPHFRFRINQGSSWYDYLMIWKMQRGLPLFFMIISTIFTYTSIAQAAPTFPTIAEIRAAYDAGLLNSTQADILLNATRIATEHPEFTPARILSELTDIMGFSAHDVTSAIYADAFRALEFARTI